MAEYRLVPNGPKYWEFIRNLRNLEGVRQGFVQQDEIDAISHATYMLQYNNNFWICLDNAEPIGYVGVIDDDIRIATNPTAQGKGAGTFMINEIMKIEPAASAKVKLENEASIKLFEKCGFKKKYYLLEREDETQSI
jgi:RimJ/RimL family protein N-acetyltransferase